MQVFRCGIVGSDPQEAISIQANSASEAAGDYVEQQILPRHSDYDCARKFEISVSDDHGEASLFLVSLSANFAVDSISLPIPVPVPSTPEPGSEQTSEQSGSSSQP